MQEYSAIIAHAKSEEIVAHLSRWLSHHIASCMRAIMRWMYQNFQWFMKKCEALQYRQPSAALKQLKYWYKKF